MLSGHHFEPRRDGAGGEALPALRGATKVTHTQATAALTPTLAREARPG